jgi:hypothetical protein
MAFYAPVFREINYSRLLELKNAGLSDGTIARMVSDMNGFACSDADVTGYLKLNARGSGRMLVTEKAVNAAVGKPRTAASQRPRTAG